MFLGARMKISLLVNQWEVLNNFMFQKVIESIVGVLGG